MTRLTLTAIILGASLLAGCSVSKDGMSLSEYKFVDNNCSGNGFLVNESWCRDTLHASMGPYSNEPRAYAMHSPPSTTSAWPVM